MSSIQGLSLEVTVVGCNKLKDTEWISKQDPYVCLEYATSKFRTRTCTDGHKDPVFQEKFVVPLIEGLRELVVLVWNSNTLTVDDLIGTGRVQLQKVLSHGYDDSIWPIQGKNGRYTGEVRLIMHFQSANHNVHVHPSPMPATPTTGPYAPMHTTPAAHYAAPPAPYHAHLPPHTPAYAPPHPAPYPNPIAIMPTPAYHTPQPSHYPAAPQTYPPAPHPHTYPHPQTSTYPPGPLPGLYPPHPY